MNNIESKLQSSCVDWFRFQYPHLKMLLFAIPNGGQRNIITAKKLKREGVVAGVPDLFLSIPKNGWNGFYIEMKSEKNKLTQAQEDFFLQAKKYNYKCEVIKSIDQFIREVNYYINSNV